MRREFVNSLSVGWFLMVRHVRHAGKGTTGLIIFIMALAFLNLVVVSGLLVGLISGSFKQFREDYSGDMIVTSAANRDYIENSPALVSFLKSDPEVTNISARYVTTASVLGTLNDLPEKNQQPNRIAVPLVGIDPANEESLTHFSRFVKYGKPLVEGENGYILIGANILKKYSSFADANIPNLNLLDNVDIGSRVRVTLTFKGGNTVQKDFIVKGIIKSKIDQVSTRLFVTSDELKRLLPVNQDQFQEIAVKLNTPTHAPALVAATKNFMGSYMARIQTSEQAIPSFLRDIETTMNVIGNALSSIALVVASITIFIVIFINAVTKRKFIGIMKGIGISPAAIQYSYVLQAFFYGLMGSAIGLVLTFGVLKPYFDAYPIDFPFSDGILVATPGGAAVRIAILLAVALAAGYFPAKLIVRKNTLDSILGR